ncbi:T/G mismatch-specific endonuclease [Camelimonas lactis]|uniref:T/G mismatch-specific endonuclease n=2 Tax=Camelimonas lactis TaxID=659006 RepID=A0A4R2GQD9_9HYPH|nr:T/G mismatch-specific endonuclease [Camelimonas lactis]
MRAVRSVDTRPEMVVRRLLHAMGYRYRLHRRDLPGAPDIVFPGRRKLIFVHGCFWHGHDCARGARMPAANADYWRSKIARNLVRDADHLAALRQAGWQALVIWECQLKVRDRPALTALLRAFLEDAAPPETAPPAGET